MTFDSTMSPVTFGGETVNTGLQYIIAGGTPESLTSFSVSGQQALTAANAPENITITDIENNDSTQNKVFPEDIVPEERPAAGEDFNSSAVAVAGSDDLIADAALTLPLDSPVAASASTAAAVSFLNGNAGVKANSASGVEPNITAAASETAFAGFVNIAVKSTPGNSTEYNISSESGNAVVTAPATGSVNNYISGFVDSGSFTVSGAFSGTGNYRIDNTSLRAIDAEKSGVGDVNLCWAATDSNMLYWAGWGKNTGSLTVSVEDDLLDYYKKYFTDVGSFIDAGIKWFFTGQYDYQGYSNLSQLKAYGGGGLFSSLTLSNYLKMDSKPITAMSSLDSFLKGGDVCGLGIYWTSGNGGHAVTCWGFSYNDSLAKSNKNYYTGVWISDSDDNYGGGRTAPDVIRYCPVSWNNRSKCYIVDYGSNIYGWLSQVVGLKRTFTINDYDPVSGEPVQGGTQTVFSGGTTYSNIISSGGCQIVNSGGVTSGTIVSSGGSQLVSAAGTANTSVINSGGYQTVASGGTAADDTVNAGGDMNVSSGGIVSGSLNVSGGHVTLDNTDSLNSMRTLSYVLSTAKTDDVLITVKGGNLGTWTQVYSLNVDNAAKGSYILASGADLSGMTGNVFTITYNNLSTSLLVGSSYVFADGNKLSLNLSTSNGVTQLKAVFSADTQPPTAPAGLSRAVTGRSVAFDWADSTDDSRVRMYEIRVDNNANFSSPEYAAAPVGSSANVNVLADGKYYWDVRSMDEAGHYSAWSNGSSFVVDTAAPSAPSGLTRTVTGSSVALNWADAKDKLSGVQQYQVEVDNNADFSSPEYTASPVTSSINFTGLAESGYFWRVRAEDNSGNYSAWSDGSSFAGDPAGNSIRNASQLSSAPAAGAVGFGDAADFYKITMTNAGTLTLGLTGLSGNANLYLLNASGALLKSSVNPGTADEAINNAALLAGTYYVKVAAVNNSNIAAYTLTNQISYFPGDTNDKAGNTIATAKIQDATPETGWVGLGDNIDYYRIDLPTPTQLTLRLDMTGGNANLALYNAQGRRLDASVKSGALEDMITANLTAGTYYARVNAVSGNSIDYTLDFNKKSTGGLLAS